MGLEPLGGPDRSRPRRSFIRSAIDCRYINWYIPAKEVPQKRSATTGNVQGTRLVQLPSPHTIDWLLCLGATGAASASTARGRRGPRVHVILTAKCGDILSSRLAACSVNIRWRHDKTKIIRMRTCCTHWIKHTLHRTHPVCHLAVIASQALGCHCRETYVWISIGTPTQGQPRTGIINARPLPVHG